MEVAAAGRHSDLAIGWVANLGGEMPTTCESEMWILQMTLLMKIHQTKITMNINK